MNLKQLNENSLVQCGAMETALGMAPSHLPNGEALKPKKRRRGPSTAQLKHNLKAMERRVALLSREIEVLRKHMPMQNEIDANLELWDLKGHP